MTSALDKVEATLADVPLADRVASPSKGLNGVNGVGHGHGSPRTSIEGDGKDEAERLRRELVLIRREKDDLSGQYNNLVARLNTMRNTLGNKLKQDAEELDRREQAIQQLTAQNEDLTSTIQTLQSEIITSNSEAEQASRELEAMRNRALEEDVYESQSRERELLDLRSELEHCRIERDDWMRTAEEDKAYLEDARNSVATLTRELDNERQLLSRSTQDLEKERENCANLQSVLEDFQRSKEHELKQATKDYEVQLLQTTQMLAEFKSRALNAELQLEETSNNNARLASLEQELKEKTLLNGKLRHEAVILNEHLVEALRRIRKNSTDNNVDRRLVTNVLLSFLTTERRDTKRFEMLNLLASILSWSNPEREKAGLQKIGSSSAVSRTTMELDKTDETESFSQMWVEFLLKEANLGGPSPTSSSVQSPSRQNSSLPASPARATFSPTKKTTRLPSFTVTSSNGTSNHNISSPRKSSSQLP